MAASLAEVVGAAVVLRARMRGSMPFAAAMSCCAFAHPLASLERAAAACSLTSNDSCCIAATRGSTPPSASTTDWLSASIERESAHSAYSRASWLPSLSSVIRSEALPDAAIVSAKASFSLTRRHRHAAARFLATSLPVPSMLTRSAAACRRFVSFRSPSAAIAWAACSVARPPPLARRSTTGAMAPAEARFTLFVSCRSASTQTAPAASALTASVGLRASSCTKEEMAPHSVTSVWFSV